MIQTRSLDMSPTVNDTMIEDFSVDASWAIRSIYHTVLKSTPRADIFGRNMLFDIPFVANWNETGHRREKQVESTNTCENIRRLPHDYTIGHNILIRKDGILRKTETTY